MDCFTRKIYYNLEKVNILLDLSVHWKLSSYIDKVRISGQYYSTTEKKILAIQKYIQIIHCYDRITIGRIRINEVGYVTCADTKFCWFFSLRWGWLCGWWSFWRALDRGERVRENYLSVVYEIVSLWWFWVIDCLAGIMAC